jgi:predicted N-formylglutamate amidohydrolase
LMEQFWLPYNTNLRLGKLIEHMMAGRKKRRLTVLCGHSHTPVYIRVSRNVDCQVGEPHNFFKINSQIIYI